MESTNKTHPGETRVRVDFNVANSSDVTKVKIESAKA
jgi:predicted secreted Zn-dependent protease